MCIGFTTKKYGGTDIDDWRKYTIVEDLQYSDKGGHKKRSIFNAPKHLKHWSKNT